MKRWMEEDWEFQTTVLRVNPDDNPVNHCRVGLEVGDVFICWYDCPAGFCPKTMFKLHTLCEAVRAGGDLRLLGGDTASGICFSCADGPVVFRLEAVRVG